MVEGEGKLPIRGIAYSICKKHNAYMCNLEMMVEADIPEALNTFYFRVIEKAFANKSR